MLLDKSETKGERNKGFNSVRIKRVFFVQNKDVKKDSFLWLFTSIGLFVLLIVSVVLGMTGYYFSVAYQNANSDFVVGDVVEINVIPNQATVASFTFDGGFLPEENIPQIVHIKSMDLNNDVFLRVKSLVFGGESDESFDFITTEHFEKGVDGYYYFDGLLLGGEKISFCNYLKYPLKSDFEPDKKYILAIVVETLDSEVEIEKIWKMSNNM